MPMPPQIVHGQIGEGGGGVGVGVGDGTGVGGASVPSGVTEGTVCAAAVPIQLEPVDASSTTASTMQIKNSRRNWVGLLLRNIVSSLHLL